LRNAFVGVCLQHSQSAERKHALRDRGRDENPTAKEIADTHNGVTARQ
jgi:hypothetical protein